MRRLAVTTAAGLLMLGVFAGCSSGSSVSVDNGKLKVDKNGNKITVKNGDSSFSVGDTQLPDSFPKNDVPLPKGGTLKAVIAGKRKGDEYFTLSYAMTGGDVRTAATDYKGALQGDGYRIESSSSAGASAAVFSAFTALGPHWDVVVYSGGSTNADGLLSLQVTTHDPSKDPSSSGATTG